VQAQDTPLTSPAKARRSPDTTISAQNIGNRSVSAALWGVLGTVLRMLMQVLSQIVLARILGPEQFGLFAAALVVVLFSTFFADVGIAYGLIQRRTVTDEDVRFVFTWQMLLGSVVSLLLFAAAPSIAGFYSDERLVSVLQWLSVTCVISALGSTASALLRRRLDFKAIHEAALVSYLIGFFVLGIPLAMAGFGVHALIVAFLVQSTLASVLMLRKSVHPVRPLLWHANAPGILSFGATVLGTNLVNWVMTSMDRIVVGRTMSITATGLYSTVHNFVTVPTMNALSVIQGVLYSASATVQDSKARLRKGFCTMFGAVALFVTPVFAAVAAISDTFMAAVYGEKWLGAGQLLTPLSLAMPALLLMGMAVPALWASGNAKKELKLQIPIALIWALSLMLVAQTGSLTWLSWSVCALFYARAGVIVFAGCRAIRLRLALLPRLLHAPVMVTATVSAVAWGLDRGLEEHLASPHLRLVVVIFGCAISLLVAIRLLHRFIRKEVIHLVGRVAERLPAWGRDLLLRSVPAGTT